MAARPNKKKVNPVFTYVDDIQMREIEEAVNLLDVSNTSEGIRKMLLTMARTITAQARRQSANDPVDLNRIITVNPTGEVRLSDDLRFSLAQQSTETMTVQ